MKRLRILLLYPILLPLFPVLSFVDHNFDTVHLSILLPLLFGILLCTIIVWATVDFFIRDREKSALVTAVALFGLFSYRVLSVHRASLDVISLLIPWQVLAHPAVPLLFLLLLAFIGSLISQIKKSFGNVTLLLNLLSISLLITPMFSLVLKQYARTYRPPHTPLPSAPALKAPQVAERPDVYYLIIEEYGTNRNLKNYYQFDNQPFTDFLKEKGFYVAEDSVANYPETYSSLDSSLNMHYLDDLVEKMGKLATDATPYADGSNDSAVMHFFQNAGYRYMQFDYTSAGINANPKAQFNYVYTSKHPTVTQEELKQQAQQNNFVASFLLRKLGTVVARELSYEPNKWRISIDQMFELSKVPELPGPKFVFMHSLITHPPYDFDRNGYPMSETLIENGYFPKEYIDQLIFTNDLLQNLIETILARSAKPPIIIIQADEGPLPRRYLTQWPQFDWRTATADEMKEKNGILNAYFFPNKDYDSLYLSISPVNSFRVVLNRYFGQQLPLLPDKTYTFTYVTRPYDLFEITDLIH